MFILYLCTFPLYQNLEHPSSNQAEDFDKISSPSTTTTASFYGVYGIFY
ncbi:hypothetical protein RU88_GL000116 [Lactococcus raffinolactis]|nr:hypothetical protein RU88_GL000116 [Lactococcus raffinolactis]